MNVSELKDKVQTGELKQLHTSRARGYESRKGEGSVHQYKGRFGEGYVHRAPCFNSSQYVWITYYVK